MKIGVDLEEIVSCEYCGAVFDKTIVKTKETTWGTIEHICPVCKKQQFISE